MCRRRVAVVAVLLVKDRFATFLGNRQLPTGPKMPVWREWDGLDKRHQVRQLFFVESFRVKQELRDARPTLCFQVRVMSVPFVRGGFRDSTQGAICHPVFSELRCLQVPRDTVDVIVWVASDAFELSLETKRRGVKQFFTLAKCGFFLWPPQINSAFASIAQQIDYRKAIVEPVHNIGSITRA